MRRRLQVFPRRFNDRLSTVADNHFSIFSHDLSIRMLTRSFYNRLVNTRLKLKFELKCWKITMRYFLFTNHFNNTMIYVQFIRVDLNSYVNGLFNSSSLYIICIEFTRILLCSTLAPITTLWGVHLKVNPSPLVRRSRSWDLNARRDQNRPFGHQRDRLRCVRSILFQHMWVHTYTHTRKHRLVCGKRKTRLASGDSIHWLKSPSICHCQGGGDSLLSSYFSICLSPGHCLYHRGLSTRSTQRPIPLLF